jgi:hypothetical protein
MDPEVALQKIRRLVGAAQLAAEAFEPTTESGRTLVEMAEAFAGLDTWLSGGGFLPKDWRPRV